MSPAEDDALLGEGVCNRSGSHRVHYSVRKDSGFFRIETMASGSPEDVNEHLPLSPPVFHVLLALGRDSLHGYAIMQAFYRLTGGRGELLPGTLYATLARMLETGLVVEVEPPSEGGDARRRYYRITDFGRALAAAEAERMRGLVDVAAVQSLAGGPS